MSQPLFSPRGSCSCVFDKGGCATRWIDDKRPTPVFPEDSDEPCQETITVLSFYAGCRWKFHGSQARSKKRKAKQNIWVCRWSNALKMMVVGCSSWFTKMHHVWDESKPCSGPISTDFKRRSQSTHILQKHILRDDASTQIEEIPTFHHSLRCVATSVTISHV